MIFSSSEMLTFVHKEGCCFPDMLVKDIRNPLSLLAHERNGLRDCQRS